MGGAVKASLVGELLPAGVVAAVGDVALALPGLQLPQVQPGAVVLQGATNTTLHKPLPLPSCLLRAQFRYLQPGVAQRLVHAEALPHLHLQQVVDQVGGCGRHSGAGQHIGNGGCGRAPPAGRLEPFGSL